MQFPSFTPTGSFPHLTGAALLLAASLGTLTAQTTEWVYHKTADGSHPDGNEQQMVWLMNRGRANPAAEGAFLTNSGNADIAVDLSYNKVNTTLLQSEFNAIPARPPAAFDRRLYAACKAHYDQYLFLNDATDAPHSGQINRITSAGFTYSAASVSVAGYALSPIHGHGSLNIDWAYGVPNGMQTGRGHRNAIMSNQSAFLSNAGFSLIPDNNINTDYGPLVFCGAYCSANTTAANHYNRFLTGTVWTDANANNRYDPGEGLNNVRIQPNSGTFYAITGAAGGWSIPITTAATYTLTFSGGPLTSNLTRSATVAADSVLVDVKTGPNTAQTLTLAMAISVSPIPNSTNLTLTWSGGTPPYQLQRSTTLAPNSWTNVGSSTSATTAKVTPSGPRSYYRVTGS